MYGSAPPGNRSGLLLNNTPIRVLVVLFPLVAIRVGCVIRHSNPCSTSRSNNNLPSLEFSSRFVSALQHNRTEYSLERLLYLFYYKEAVKFLTHYFLLYFRTKLLADGVKIL